VLTLTASIRDLKITYPHIHIKVDTTCKEIWENNPYIEDFSDELLDFEDVLSYDLVHQSNNCGKHMIHGFKEDIEKKLDVKFNFSEFKCDVFLSDTEKGWLNQFEDTFKKKEPFWIINAGSKSDFPLKQWPHEKWQEVVDALKHKINFVQVGSKEHNHKPLEGAYNLLGKTDLRQLIRLSYHAVGGLGHVSMLNHLMSCWSKPCIVVAGGRETSTWEGYNCTHYVHTIGLLKCCSMGGCWKSKLEQCPNMENNKFPRCMNIINSDDVVSVLGRYIK
jgi:ADP-heptose:LPS heptosyltransferase